MKPGLRVDIAAVEAAVASDVQDTDHDPQRILKVSHSLRVQLAQPRRNRSAQRDGSASFASMPGLRNSLQTSPHARANAPGQSPPLEAHQIYPVHQMPPTAGHGTKSGPHSGFASKAWLQGEFRQDVDELWRHVDEYVTKREQRSFDVERSALKGQISHLQKHLEEEEAKVAKLQAMLPDENGEFKSLRAELDELEREADVFCDLYEREAKATSAALEGFRQALADVNDIELEFQRISTIINALPEARVVHSSASPHIRDDHQPNAGGQLAITSGQRHVVTAPPLVHPRAPEADVPRKCCNCFCVSWRRG